MMDMIGGMGVMMLIVLVAAAVLIGLAVYLGVRAAGRRDGSPQSSDPQPQELLERRLVEGEITPEEFYERESVLRGPHGKSSRT